MEPDLTGVHGRLGSGANEVLTALIESVADAVYAVDADGRVRYVNPAGLTILGYDDETELLGRVSHATIHHTRPDGTPFPPEECPLLLPRTSGEIVRVEEDWFVRRDGTLVPVAYSSAPVALDRGRGAVVVFRDITSQRQAESVRASRARIVEATLEERRRLGRDLHDGAQQHLVNVAIGLQLAANRAGGQAELRELLDGALAETRQAIAELRELASGLHPSVLTHRGLCGAIESLTARATVPVAIDVTEQRFAPVIEAAAYFVVAEALTNVAKHAAATEASVKIESAAGGLIVTVTDDGHGGATPVALADRVAAVDGTLAVDSPAGGPTTIRATLPLSSPAAA